jgi:hypothetical protein
MSDVLKLGNSFGAIKKLVDVALTARSFNPEYEISHDWLLVGITDCWSVCCDIPVGNCGCSTEAKA